MENQWKVCFDNAGKDLDFEFSELAGYIGNGIVEAVFQYAFEKGHEEGWNDGWIACREDE